MRIQKIKSFLNELGCVIEKEIVEQEVLIVTSSELGLKNLLIDLEGEQIIFSLTLGEIKNEFPIYADTRSLTRLEVMEICMEFNNPLSEDNMKTGQFALSGNKLMFSEQEFLESMDLKSFENVMTGFSEVLLEKFDFIDYVVESKGE
jgi:hypothetical protein